MVELRFEWAHDFVKGHVPYVYGERNPAARRPPRQSNRPFDPKRLQNQTHRRINNNLHTAVFL